MGESKETKKVIKMSFSHTGSLKKDEEWRKVADLARKCISQVVPEALYPLHMKRK